MLEIIQKIIFEVTGKSEVTIDTDFVWKLHQVRDVIEYARQRGIEE